MTKKQSVLLVIVVVLLCVYVYYFIDWFVLENIQIVHIFWSYMPLWWGRGCISDDNLLANTVSFGFNLKYRLTKIKVIPVSDLATNKYAHPIWHLVSESNSVPTKAFVYGMNIQGMHPKVPGARPDPLQPGIAYRLFVDAGELKGEHEFKTTPRTGPRK